MSKHKSANKGNIATNAEQPRTQRRNIDYGSYGMGAPNGNADTKRNLSAAFGYVDNITFTDYYAYAHRGLGKAVVNGYPERCFAIDPIIIDGEDDGKKREKTRFETEVLDMVERLHLWQRFKECYRLNRIGNYAAIIPTFAETQKVKLTDEVTKINGVDGILKLTPYNQAQAAATTDETIDDFSSVNFGLPKYFDVRPDAMGDRNPNSANEVRLHRSRVFVMAEGANDGSIYGIPSLEGPFNAIFDANKVRGSGAEGYYKNAKQRTILSANNPEAAVKMRENAETIDKKINDFEADFDSMLKLAGVDASNLQTTITDPTGAWTIAMNEVCATSGYPLTVLIGFQNGDRSSTENNKDFNTNLQAVCNNFHTPTIKQFLNWLIDLGALTKPSSGKITVKWPDFLEPSTKEKLENAKLMTDTNKTAYDCNMEAVYSNGEIREAGGHDPEMEEDGPIFGEDNDDQGAVTDENTGD